MLGMKKWLVVLLALNIFNVNFFASSEIDSLQKVEMVSEEENNSNYENMKENTTTIESNEDFLRSEKLVGQERLADIFLDEILINLVATEIRGYNHQGGNELVTQEELNKVTYIEINMVDITMYLASVCQDGRTMESEYKNEVIDFYGIERLTNLKTLIAPGHFGEGKKNLENISKLKKIEILDLSCSGINDTNFLKEINSLKNLSLQKNQIQDISPITNLSNLGKLYLDNNQIVDLPPFLEDNSLTYVSLNNNFLTKMDNSLNLNRLTELFISNNKVSNIIGIAGATELKTLYADDNNIEDISMLANKNELSTLSLNRNKIKDINFLKNSLKLKWLYVDRNGISDFSIIDSLPNLVVYGRNQKIVREPQKIISGNITPGTNEVDSILFAFKGSSKEELKPTYISNQGIYNNVDKKIMWEKSIEREMVVYYVVEQNIGKSQISGIIVHPISEKEIEYELKSPGNTNYKYYTDIQNKYSAFNLLTSSDESARISQKLRGANGTEYSEISQAGTYVIESMVVNSQERIEKTVDILYAEGAEPYLVFENTTHYVGEEFNPLDGVTLNSLGLETQGEITVIYNNINNQKSGTYFVEYQYSYRPKTSRYFFTSVINRVKVVVKMPSNLTEGDTKYYFSEYGFLTHSEKYVNSKIREIIYYSDNTLFEDKGNNRIREKQIFDEQGYITTKFYYNQGEIKEAFEYYPSTNNDEKIESNIMAFHSFGANSTLLKTTNYSKGIASNRGKELSHYEYYAGTKYDSNYKKHIRLEYLIDVADKITVAKKKEDITGTNQVIYSFYSNTSYDGNHWKHVQFEYTVDVNNNITIAKRKRDGRDSIMIIYNFYPNTKYDSNRWNHVRFEYAIDTDSNITTAKSKKDGGTLVTGIYNFYPNTKYDSNRWNHVKFEYAVDAKNVITSAKRKRDGGTVVTVIYNFYPNTKYDGNRWNHVKFSYHMTANNYIQYAYRYKDNSQIATIKYEFQQNTKYDESRWQKVEKTLVL